MIARRTFLGRLRAALTAPPLRIAVVAAALAAAAAAAVLFGLPQTRRAPDGRRRRRRQADARRLLVRPHLAGGRHAQGASTGTASLVGFHYDYFRYRMLQSADGSYRLTQLGRTRRATAIAPATATATDVRGLRRLEPASSGTIVRDAGSP